MITDEERRNAARRLGILHDAVMERLHGPTTVHDIAVAIDYPGSEDNPHDGTVVGYLADLIEPQPERTCQMVSAFDTDELEDYQESVSFTPEDTLVYMCKSCGFDFRYERGLYPNYCPNCGAKVINDA